MKVLVSIVLAAGAVFAPCSAFAGAWTLPAGDTQIISGVTISSAKSSFDNSGGATPIFFRKYMVSAYAEHGISDDVTLIFAPEFVKATEQLPGQAPVRANDFAAQAGARLLLDDSFGVSSIQATYKSAGAFDMSVSAHKENGSEFEFRALYGTNFTVFGRDGYVDLEVAQRIIGGARPNETPIDLTVGLHVWHDYTVIAQSFNIIADGDGRPPFRYYRSHKIELSLLQRLWGNVYLESGAFISPLGQSSLVERGADASIWVQF